MKKSHSRVEKHMGNTNTIRSFCDDLPKITVNDDLLGLAEFAKAIANGITFHKNESGVVISINAPWGYGKTSCLNFIKGYLQQDQNIEILDFNPWCLSDNKNDIVIKFLHSLGSKLQDILQSKETESIKNKKLPWNEKLSHKYFLHLKKCWNHKHDNNNFNVLWKGILGYFSATAVEQLEKQYLDIDLQKRQIERLLLKIDKRLVIFIDDLDRLPKEEIRQVFRFMKAIADFNFITYVVAFDNVVVSKALDGEFCDSGFDYIKKIVQVPLELPKIYQENIDSIFHKKLNALINYSQYDITKEKQQRFMLYNTELIKKHIKNIRDINRLFNSFTLNYLQVYNDVDLVDFLAIEIIRVFEPNLYFEIRDNLSLYTGDRPFMAKSEKEEYFNNLKNKYAEYIDFITEMFPVTNALLKGGSYGPEWAGSWNKDKRICSIERSNIYFSLKLPIGEISDKEVIEFLQSISKQKDLDNAVLQWAKEKYSNGHTKLFYWVPKLELFADKISEYELVELFVSTIFKFKNSFVSIGDMDDSGLLINNDLRFLGLYNALTKNIKDEVKLFGIIKNAVVNSDNLSAIAEFVLSHAISHGLFPNMKDQVLPTITKEHYFELETLLLDKIRKHIKEIHTLSKPTRLLQFINVRCGALYNRIMDYYMTQDEQFLTLIENCYSYASSSSEGTFRMLSLWPITAYISEDKLIEKVQDIAKNKPKLKAKADNILKGIEKAKEFHK